MERFTIGNDEENLASGFPYISAVTFYGGVSAIVRRLRRKQGGELLAVEAKWSAPRQGEGPEKRTVDLVICLGFLWSDENPVRFEIEQVLPIEKLYPSMRYRWQDFVEGSQEAYLTDVVAETAGVEITHSVGYLEAVVTIKDSEGDISWMGTGKVPFKGVLTEWVKPIV